MFDGLLDCTEVWQCVLKVVPVLHYACMVCVCFRNSQCEMSSTLTYMMYMYVCITAESVNNA